METKATLVENEFDKEMWSASAEVIFTDKLATSVDVSFRLQRKFSETISASADVKAADQLHSTSVDINESETFELSN